MNYPLDAVQSRVTTCLLDIAAFCAYHSELCNCHTVDFIIGKKEELLSSQLQDELYGLNIEQLQALTDINVPSFLTERDAPHLFRFITDAKAHTLEVLKICSSLSAVSSSLPKTSIARKSPYWCMSPKKSHEVEILASVISSLAEDRGIKVVMDVGSGKGYLSSYLALEHKLNVLAIDSSSSNTSRANERNKKVLYYWNKSRKKRNSALNDTKSNFSSCTFCSMENHKIGHCGANSKSSLKYSGEINCSNPAVDSPGGLFVTRTHHVSASCDLKCFIHDFLMLLQEKNVRSCENSSDISLAGNQILLCSLHGCGNLSASLLKLFVSIPQTKILCTVGCCYHLIEETFFKNLFTTNGPEEVQEFGFPLSSHLLENKYVLGRNARMLASQSIERISSERETDPKKALYYRALLEVILRDKLGGTSHIHTVGRIAAKCSGFFEYVQRALRELKLDHLQLSESDTEEYLRKYSKEEKKLYALQQLRIIMAPCIEALILLDRLVFLLEQEVVKEAHLVRLFDAVTSPRCYGIIAWK